MSRRNRILLIAISSLALALTACGADSAPAKPSAAKAASSGGGGGKKGGKKGKKGKKLEVYAKVAADLRRELGRADFTPDPTGDVNRDPFRSYLVQPQSSTKGQRRADEDECLKRMVAPKYGLRDLKLSGIVLKGTQSMALFVDGQRLGHIARRGDCLSKDKVRLKDIGSDRVILEVRGDAPPGAPAPAPREEVWRLHPKELELSDEQLNPEEQQDEVEIGAE